jgi:hypothetical protein
MHGTIMVFLGVVPLAVGGRELRGPAPDWSPGHGVPEAEYGELPGFLPRRRNDAPQLFVPGEPRSRVDVIRAASVIAGTAR